MKELKAELKRGILHGKIIYVMMMVAILFALGWTENLSQAIEFRENANIVFSSIQHVLYVLYFDRFKAVMIAVLSLLCAGSVYEDISSGFFLFQKLRVGRIERYVISKIAANMFLVTTATIGGIWLFVAFVRPLMPLVGNNPQQDIVEYYDIYQTLGPILYLAAMGLIFGLSASFFTSFGLWIVFYMPDRFAAHAISFLVYYGLLSITDFLPKELDIWNLTSAAKMLRMTDSSFWNYLYSVSLLLVLNAISGIVLWKKLFVVCFITALVFGLAGCSKEEKLKPEKSSQQTSTTQPEAPSNNDTKQDKVAKEKDTATSLPSNQKEVTKADRKGDYDATLSNLKASVDDDMLRLDLTCSGDENGKISLSDGATTKIGPIDIQKGDYTVYFLLNADSNATYTLTIEAASGKKAEFTITQKMIHAAMDETAMDSNESDVGNQ